MSANVSPGVYWREIDLSSYVPRLSSSIYASVGTATKGPVNDRVLITTPDQLVKTFGYPSTTHYALYAILQYLKAGNETWFVRIESQSAPAEPALIAVPDIEAASVDVTSKDPGSFYNGLDLRINHDTPRRQILEVPGADFTGVGPYVHTFLGGTLLNKNTVKIYQDATLVLTDDGAGALTGLANYAGTVNYITGQIDLSFVDDPTGTAVSAKASVYTSFTMQVVKTIEAQEYTLETFATMDLDPLSEQYYKTVMKSSFLLALPTFAAFPAEGNYTLAAGEDGLTGLDASDYIGTNLGGIRTGSKLFELPDEIDINLIATPGMTHDAVVQNLLSIAQTRGDCIAIIDPPEGLSPEEVVDWADGNNEYAAQNAINSSYAAIYYPWVRTWDEYNDGYKMLPPSGFAAAAFAKTDKVWDAPAGSDFGKLLGVTGTERALSHGEREFLYRKRINPVNDFAATGIMIYGQRTAQVHPSALDRLNVRRLLTYMEKVLVTALQPFVFKPNNFATWEAIKQVVQPYLNSLIAQGALEDGKIVVNEITNTSDVINRNELVANIILIPTKTAEVITLNFVILPSGANIDEYVGKSF